MQKWLFIFPMIYQMLGLKCIFRLSLKKTIFTGLACFQDSCAGEAKSLNEPTHTLLPCTKQGNFYCLNYSITYFLKLVFCFTIIELQTVVMGLQAASWHTTYCRTCLAAWNLESSHVAFCSMSSSSKVEKAALPQP